MSKYVSEALKQQLATKSTVLQFIANIAWDYDGYRSEKLLMDLIDEMRQLALYGCTLEQ